MQDHTLIHHPLEDAFDIAPGTTVIPSRPPPMQPMVSTSTDHTGNVTYDDRDDEIEQQLQSVYGAAMAAYEEQQESALTSEAKYRSRSAEVAANFLNTALAAVKEKASFKQHKDKIANNETAAPKTVNNNLIVTDRNAILKALLNPGS